MGTEDDPVLVLRPMVLVVLQLFPLDAHSHWPQLLIHTKVAGMLCEGRVGEFRVSSLVMSRGRPAERTAGLTSHGHIQWRELITPHLLNHTAFLSLNALI